MRTQYARTIDPAEQKRLVDAVQKSYFENVTHRIPGNVVNYNVMNANLKGVHDYYYHTRMTGVWFDEWLHDSAGSRRSVPVEPSASAFGSGEIRGSDPLCATVADSDPSLASRYQNRQV